jgi:hypothetical protein
MNNKSMIYKNLKSNIPGKMQLGNSNSLQKFSF